MPKKKKPVEQEIPIKEETYLDDLRSEYKEKLLSGGTGWEFSLKAVREAVELYAEIMGTKDTAEHKRVIEYLFKKDE